MSSGTAKATNTNLPNHRYSSTALTEKTSSQLKKALVTFRYLKGNQRLFSAKLETQRMPFPASGKAFQSSPRSRWNSWNYFPLSLDPCNTFQKEHIKLALTGWESFCYWRA